MRENIGQFHPGALYRLANELHDPIISRDGYHVACEQCGEEIINEREVRREGQLLCRHCAGYSYYDLRVMAPPAPAANLAALPAA